MKLLSRDFESGTVTFTREDVVDPLTTQCPDLDDEIAAMSREELENKYTMSLIHGEVMMKRVDELREVLEDILWGHDSSMSRKLVSRAYAVLEGKPWVEPESEQ